VLSHHLAVFRCASSLKEWYCDGNALYWCIVFCSEECNASYLDWRRKSSTECGTQNDTDWKVIDIREVVGIETSQLNTTSADAEGEYTPEWFWVDWEPTSKTEGPGGKIHFTGCISSMEGSAMVASILFTSVGRHWRLQQSFSALVWWMTTQYLSGFANFPITEQDISINACQRTCQVSRTWG